MSTPENPVLICEEDYRQLKQYAGEAAENTMSLAYELGRATIVKDEDLPADVIRLNSRVIVEEEVSKKKTEFKIVMPPFADISKRKISILTPMAAALIGFKKGDAVSWKMPAGLKSFKILEVSYEAAK